MVAAVLAAAAGLARRGRPALVAAWLCQAAMVGPLLGFFQNGPQLVADRYSYLSTLGWAILAAAGLLRVLRSAPRRGAAAAAVAGAAAVVIGLAALSWRQIGVWRSTASLWSHAYAGDPASSIANNGYGYVLLSAGRVEESVPRFREAVRVDPRNREAWQNLWNALGRLKDDAARHEALVAATGSPRADVRGEAHYLLGNDLLQQQRNAEAAGQFEASLAAVEGSAAAHSNLAMVLVRLGRLDEAVALARRAIVLDRTLANASDGLARTYALQGRMDEAIAALEALLAEQPGYAPARSRLEELRRRRGS
jgi:tetratricopeptide (TPR) repeat protein